MVKSVNVEQQSLSTAEVTKLLAILEDDKRALEEELRTSTEFAPKFEGNEPDPSDSAMIESLCSDHQHLETHKCYRLNQVKIRIVDLTSGRFQGQCEECSNPIGIARLEAKPYAALCIDCQTSKERPYTGARPHLDGVSSSR